ncbi:MAG: SPFH domain-containing protein [Planctomycetes bacterium]|nr:SPFH domain-containing protein [Planctomycetota bacterium]
MPGSESKEHAAQSHNGWSLVIVVFLLFIAGIAGIVRGGILAESDAGRGFAAAAYIIGGALVVVAASTCCAGFFIVNPNESRALVLFGRYRGTVRDNGFFWTNPFTVKRKVSLRARNHTGETLKVNDLNGNPIEIAAVVVWRVRNTAQALFDVDDYAQFVEVQSESAVRQLASSHPYDAAGDEIVSLRANSEEVAASLQVKLNQRLGKAGCEVLESRLTHIAYAPEIAGAMLQRQQAEAVIAARQKIVDGAVGMVELALARLQRDGIVELDEERKAAMVSNLLVVLCSERGSQPIVNAGTLYS